MNKNIKHKYKTRKMLNQVIMIQHFKINIKVNNIIINQKLQNKKFKFLKIWIKKIIDLNKFLTFLRKMK